MAKQAANEDQDEGGDYCGKNDLNDSEFIKIDSLYFNEVVDPKPGALSKTQLGSRRLNRAPNTYLLGKFSPPLYQTNPSARQTYASETGEIECELTIADTPATA
jgi:hypothetical protein